MRPGQVPREAGGIVAPGAEYRTVRDEVIGRLEALIDPETGEPAADGVLTAEQLYGERIAARAPDLVVEWRGSMYLPVDLEDVPAAVFVFHRTCLELLDVPPAPALLGKSLLR